MLRTIAAAGAAWILSLVAPPAFGAAYLVGAQLYSCMVDGTNGGGPFGNVYQYSTNSATIHNPLSVSGLSSLQGVPLVTGSNAFTFGTGGISPGAYACMNLFFADTAPAFNPPYDTENPVPGDLTVIAPVDGVGFAFPVAGIDVQSFNSTGSAVIHTSYSGATSIAVGGAAVTVTAFTVAPNITGTFTLLVPEPGAPAAASIALAALLALRARFR